TMPYFVFSTYENSRVDWLFEADSLDDARRRVTDDTLDDVISDEGTRCIGSATVEARDPARSEKVAAERGNHFAGELRIARHCPEPAQPASHSITSSARARIEGGMVRRGPWRSSG